MFGSWKVSKKEKKNVKENYFLIFGFIIKNTKKNKSNIIKIIKLFNIYFSVILFFYRIKEYILIEKIKLENKLN